MKLIAIVMSFLFLTACASVGVTPIKRFPPKSEECDLQVFTSVEEIKRPFEVACLLDAKTASHLFADKTVAGAIDLARPEACKCGADAILFSSGNSEGVSAFSWGTGTAIVKAIHFSDKISK